MRLGWRNARPTTSQTQHSTSAPSTCGRGGAVSTRGGQVCFARVTPTPLQNVSARTAGRGTLPLEAKGTKLTGYTRSAGCALGPGYGCARAHAHTRPRPGLARSNSHEATEPASTPPSGLSGTWQEELGAAEGRKNQLAADSDTEPLHRTHTRKGSRELGSPPGRCVQTNEEAPSAAPGRSGRPRIL